MIEAVLDASAVLADLQGEPGGEAARIASQHAAVSAVNFAEVITKLIDRGMPGKDAQALAETAAYRVIPADQARAVRVGLMLTDLRLNLDPAFLANCRGSRGPLLRAMIQEHTRRGLT